GWRAEKSSGDRAHARGAVNRGSPRRPRGVGACGRRGTGDTKSDGRGHHGAALNPADLLLPERPPADHHPAEAYLANRTPRSRDATRKALDTIASLLTSGQGSALTLAWHLLRDEQVADLRRTLMQCFPVAVAMWMLAVVRGD